MFQGSEFITTYLSRIPRNVRWVDIIEILIISFLFYQILLWIKNSKAWTFLKGIVVIVVFIGIASFFEMTTILWIVKNVLGVAVTALVVLLQPELRKALEELGTRNIFKSILPFDSGKYSEEGLFSDKTIYEIAEACVEMGKAKTGALIVVEQNQKLTEYEKTGIDIDGNISSQLLINIFEHNTPLHDGAVIVRGNKVVSATCYLPLSDNRELSKALGTRHRAGVGISEVSDSMTIIVSEETGKISVAYNGKLERNLDGEGLKAKLRSIQNKPEEEPKKRFLWKGRSKGEK